MDYVKQYLDGKTQRYELDFNYHLINRYQKMHCENCEYAEFINYYIAENGFDKGDALSDNEFKKLIKRQYYKVQNIINDDIY